MGLTEILAILPDSGGEQARVLNICYSTRVWVMYLHSVEADDTVMTCLLVSRFLLPRIL